VDRAAVLEEFIAGIPYTFELTVAAPTELPPKCRQSTKASPTSESRN
jgi:hypothetical protein